MTPTVFVKLVFLAGCETQIGARQAFYDFLPYKYGPFSFTLYREMAALRDEGYLTPGEEQVGLTAAKLADTRARADELPADVRDAVVSVVARHAAKDYDTLVGEVYRRYPWFASRSQLDHLRPPSVEAVAKAKPAVYTVGYEGKSVDRFFNDLLLAQIRLIIDVRARPFSRKYGFAGTRLRDIAVRLDIDYRHMPQLGIPSALRADLSDYASYQRLLDRYEFEMLPRFTAEVEPVGRIMQQTPAALLCMERDVRCCHRGRLAIAVAAVSGLEITHL